MLANRPKLVRAEDDLLIARNIGDDGAHSEEVLHQMLIGYQVDPSRVTAVYSEFSPCTSGHNCFRLLNEIGGFRDNLPVTYSFIRHREEALKDIAERILFQSGYPGIIKP